MMAREFQSKFLMKNSMFSFSMEIRIRFEVNRTKKWVGKDFFLYEVMFGVWSQGYGKILSGNFRTNFHKPFVLDQNIFIWF